MSPFTTYTGRLGDKDVKIMERVDDKGVKLAFTGRIAYCDKESNHLKRTGTGKLSAGKDTLELPAETGILMYNSGNKSRKGSSKTSNVASSEMNEEIEKQK